MLKIATFNVNSLRARMDVVTRWLQESSPDIALLQEIKCIDDEFNKLDFKSLGYHGISHGQKSYNGVAVLSRRPIDAVIQKNLPPIDDGPMDEQARFLSVRIGDLNIASLYCPNGNPVDSEKYSYKLKWMKELQHYIDNFIYPSEKKWILGGDYNICPEDIDVYDPIAWANDALCLPESRSAYRRIINKGFVNAWRHFNPDSNDIYSYWDYVKGRYYKNQGLLIDHLLLSPAAADILVSADIEGTPRGWEKPSDHTPVVALLDI